MQNLIDLRMFAGASLLRKGVVGGLLLALMWLVQACCTGPMCREVNSGPDRHRTRATTVKVPSVNDDSVNASAKDATDWKTFELKKYSQLVVELHWDNQEARLTVALFDSIGARVAQGEAWGQKGQRLIVPKAKKGRYFVRVQVSGEGGSHYSLRIRRKRVKGGTCHNCTVGEKICLKKDGYALCGKTPTGCNAWIQTFACPKGQSCQNGACVEGCVNQCAAEERRCAARASYQVCRKSAEGCFQWSEVTPCGRRRRCYHGKCRRRKPSNLGKTVKPPPSTETSVKGGAKGKIISMYRYRDRMTLHIEISAEAGIRAGMTGTVLRGGSQSALPNGRIKVTKVSGRYCIATTTLKKIGKNRWVRINVR